MQSSRWRDGFLIVVPTGAMLRTDSSNRHHHLLELLGRDADGAVEGDAGAGEDRGEQVALVAFGVRQEAAGVDRSASAAGDDERKVFARVFVAVFEAGVPHHI